LHYFYGEVGRIVRRLRPVKIEDSRGCRTCPRGEFIRSLDPLFRPVSNVTAPDGTIYIADMYRGIIEGAQWAKEGTYLRAKIKQNGLDKVVSGHGRIWRLTYDGLARDRTQPRMLNETPAQLVAHLTHPNGWWRDTAQRLPVLKQDKSVAPALSTMFGRRRTSWRASRPLDTEGPGALDPALTRQVLEDPDPARNGGDPGE
jgi:hypothetical protein